MLGKARQLFAKYPRQFWLMVVGVFISSAGGSMIWPFLLIYVSEKLHLSLGAAATLVAIQAGVSIVSAFVAGTLVDRIGRKVVMVVSLMCSGAVYFLLLRASSYPEFAALMAAQGLTNPLYQVGADAMLADLIPSESRAEAYAINRIAGNAGFGLGPAVGGFLAATSYALAFLGASAGFVTYAVLLLLRAQETLGRRSGFPRPDERASDAQNEMYDYGRTLKDGGHLPAELEDAREARGYGRVLRDRRYMAFACLVGAGLIAPSMVWVLLAVYTKTNFGLSEGLYGWIPTTNAFMCVFVQYFVTRATSRYRPLPVVAVGMGVYALGAGSVALMTGFWGFWLSMVILSFGELLLIPTVAKYVADLAPADLRGRYMGIYWLAWGASRTVAPIIGGLLNDNICPTAIWYGALVIGLASTLGLAALAWQTGRRNAAVPAALPRAVTRGAASDRTGSCLAVYQRLEKRRLDREEVAREDTRRLSLQEPAPANAPAGGRTDAGAAEKHRDTRRGNADPELPELALDPQVTPPGVLPRHLKDQPADLRIDRRAPGLPMRPRPLSCHE